MSFLKKDISHEQLKDMVISLESQLVNIYEERAELGSPEELTSAIESLTEQLQTFYSQQEKFGSFDEMSESLESLEAQLASFYYDVDHSEYDSVADEYKASISSLEKQVISLIDEKCEIEEMVQKHAHKMELIKSKSRELGAALFEAALFDDKKTA